MHPQVNEQQDLLRAVRLEQREESDHALRELDCLFAEAQSWHELSEPQALASAVGNHDAPGTCSSISERPHRKDAVAASHRIDEAEILRSRLEAVCKLDAQLTAQWSTENEELLALQQSIKSREERLEAVAQMADVERRKLEQQQTALEQKERELNAQHQQWIRDATERERTLERREVSVNDQQRSLDELRCRLEEQASWLEREARRLEQARACLNEQQATRELEHVQEMEVAAPMPQQEHVHPPRSADLADSQSHQPDCNAITEGDSTEESSSEEQQNDPSGCFEQMSIDDLRDASEEFDRLIDRIIFFHFARDKKWYMFWR